MRCSFRQHLQQAAKHSVHRRLLEKFTAWAKKNQEVLWLANWGMFFLILISVIFMMLETLDGPNQGSAYPDFPSLLTSTQYRHADLFFNLVFTLELALRFILAKSYWKRSGKSREKPLTHPKHWVIQDSDEDDVEKREDDSNEDPPFFRDFYIWCDFLAILPFFIEGLMGAAGTKGGKGALESIQVFRILRIMKFMRRFDGATLLLRAIYQTADALVLSIFFFFVFTLVFGCFVFFFEPCLVKGECVFEDVFSACYWVVVTMTTVGYGDQIPTRFWARCIAIIAMLFGVVYLAMPIAILGMQFDIEWKNHIQSKKLKRKKERRIERQSELKEIMTKENMSRSSNHLQDKAHQNPWNEDLEAAPTLHKTASCLNDEFSVTVQWMVRARRLVLLHPELTQQGDPDLFNWTLRQFQDFAVQAASKATNQVKKVLLIMRFHEKEAKGGVKAQEVDLTRLSDSSSTSSQFSELDFYIDSNITHEDVKPGGLKAGKEIPITSEPPSHSPNPDPPALQQGEEERMSGFGSLKRGLFGVLHHKQVSKTSVVETKDEGEEDSCVPEYLGDKCMQKKSSRVFDLSDIKKEEFDKILDQGQPELESLDTSKHTRFSTTERPSASFPEKVASDVGTGDNSVDLSRRKKNRTNILLKSRYGSMQWAQASVMGKMQVGDSFRSPRGNLRRKSSIGDGSTMSSNFSEQARYFLERYFGERWKKFGLYLSQKRKIRPPNRETNYLRFKVWDILENPKGSLLSKVVMWGLIGCIVLSTVMFCFETVPEFQVYGESSIACERAVKTYCSNKHNITLDPGCFVHILNETHINFDEESAPKHLRYFCKDVDCYGHGDNFGSGASFSCSGGPFAPFQDQDELPEIGLLEISPLKKYAICNRPECSSHHHCYADLTPLWNPLEIMIGAVFTLEMLLRFFATGALLPYITDPFNVLDVCAIIPFYVELSAASDGAGMDFSFSLSGEIYLLFFKIIKVFRMFKVLRHFPSTLVLWRTVRKAWDKLLVPMFVLMLATLFFCIIFWVLERGKSCTVGWEATCELFDGTVVDMSYFITEYGFPEGKKVRVGVDGELSSFSDARHTTWLALVTMTTVGYGGISPITRWGKTFDVLVMIFGSFYLAMPFTIVGSKFYEEFEHFKKKKLEMDISKRRSSKTLNMPIQSIRWDEHHLGIFEQVWTAVDDLHFILKQLDYWRNHEEHPEVPAPPKPATGNPIKVDSEIKWLLEEMDRIIEDFINLAEIIHYINQKMQRRASMEESLHVIEHCQEQPLAEALKRAAKRPTLSKSLQRSGSITPRKNKI